jgi:predicted lipid-binding transport protein (Tim44 family)
LGSEEVDRVTPDPEESVWDAATNRWVSPEEAGRARSHAEPVRHEPPPEPPPHRPPQLPKKSNRNKAILGTLAGLVLLGLALSFMVKSIQNNNGGKTAVATTPAPSATAVQDSQFRYTVEKTTCGQHQIQAGGTTQTAAGQFCTVRLSVHNVGTEAKAFDTNNQRVVATTGQKYSTDPMTQNAENASSGAFTTNIQPGSSQTGTVVFDVPPNAEIDVLELHSSPASAGVDAPITS